MGWEILGWGEVQNSFYAANKWLATNNDEYQERKMEDTPTIIIMSMVIGSALYLTPLRYFQYLESTYSTMVLHTSISSGIFWKPILSLANTSNRFVCTEITMFQTIKWNLRIYIRGALKKMGKVGILSQPGGGSDRIPTFWQNFPKLNLPCNCP